MSKYLELTKVSQTITGKGINLTLTMQQQEDGTFLAVEGPTGVKIRTKQKRKTLPMSEWDAFLLQKQKQGFVIYSDKEREVIEVTSSKLEFNGQNFKPLEDTSAQEIINRLISFTSECLNENYTVKLQDVPEEKITEAKKILSDLAKNYKIMSLEEVKLAFQQLFQVIPRRIDHLFRYLPNDVEQIPDHIISEQELLEMLEGHSKSSGLSHDQTITDAFHLEWRSVTEEEKEMLIKRLGSEGRNFVNAWRVVNKTTENAFNKFYQKESLTEKDISHLFHGSRNENFWSIITKGLTINPSGVVITGKMFGNGTYFAPSANKSAGYISRANSTWANGSSATGFLALYKVATGKESRRYHPCRSDSSLTYTRLQNLQKNALCTWARSSDTCLRADEVIVYQDNQSTIEYLIEIG